MGEVPRGPRPRDAPAGASVALLSLPSGLGPDAVEAAGLHVLEWFPHARVARVAGAPDDVASRAAAFGARAYPEEPLTLALAETRAAVRADDLPVEAAQRGAGVTVAVVDSGVDESHPALADRVVRHVKVSSRGAEPATGDATGHGTHVAGIVANTGVGNARSHGVAPGAAIVAVDISGAFTTTNAIRAFDYVAQNAEALGIRVVVNSWGREKAGARYDPDDPLTRAAHALVDQGLVVVFSAGNHGPGPSTLTQEAMDPHVVTVGATDDGGRVEPYSGRGPAIGPDGRALDAAKPDLLAPGTGVVSTRSGGGWVTMNGTSMAAPHVAGAAAVLLARFPDLDPQEVRDALRASARDGGVLDVAAAFDLVARAHEVVVERRVPLAVAGESAHLLGQELQAGAQTLVVPAGASGLALTVTWRGVAPEGVVATLAHAGEVRASASGNERVELAVDRPGSGPWTLTVRPQGAGGKLAWSAEGVALVHEVQEVHGVPERIGKASVRDGDDGPRLPGGLGKVATLTAALALSAGIVGVKRRK